MKLKLHDLIYLACLYGQIEIVNDMIHHQGSEKFEVNYWRKRLKKYLFPFFNWYFQPNKDTKYGFKPIEIAALNGMNDIVDLLIKVFFLIF